MLVLFLPYCLQAISSFGLTRRSDRKYTIGLALEKSIGGEGTEWHKALGNGMKFNWLLLWVEGCKSCKVCKVFDVRG